MSNIMVLGAGRGQVDLIKAIKHYGHKAIVVSIQGNYPGFDFADEIYFADITNPNEIESIVNKIQLDGICTCCMDTGMETLGYICDKFAFNGISYESAKTSRDKSLMKDLFVKGKVRTPKYVKISSKGELRYVLDNLSFPVIVKAVDQQGSLGINTVYSEENLLKAYDSTMQHTKKNYCIIEEYIEGEKHGANGCIIDNQILFFLPSQDLTLDKFVLGHIFPFETSSFILDEIFVQSMNAVKSLNLNNCIFNVDYIIKGNDIYILEVTSRLGANGIPDLLSTYYGIDIYKVIIDISLGNNSSVYFKQNANKITPCCSKMLISNKNGVLKEIRNKNNEDERIIDISYYVSPGDTVVQYKSAKNCLGQVITKGASAKECLELANIVDRNIEFILEEK